MESIYDAIIVGGGPAGLSAAIYLARAKFSVLVIEKETFGGQITITSEVVNYPGILETTGSELTAKMQEQARRFGAEFLVADVKELELQDSIKTIVTNKGNFKSIGVILATGCTPRKLGFPGEKEFQGRGVAYCATCDGEFFTGKDVFVIGGGFAAAEEAMFLTKYAKKVIMIVREEDFTCAKTIGDKVLATPNIEVHFDMEIVEAKGTHQLQSASFINTKTKQTKSYENEEGFGIFVFAGYVPANDLFKEQIELSQSGNIIVDINQKTSIDGVYGAGDICQKELRQVVTAVSDGAIAATSLEKYIPICIEALEVQTKKWHVEKQEMLQTKESNNEEAFISKDIKEQLQSLFDKLVSEVTILCVIDKSDFSLELEQFVTEFCTITDKLHLQIKNIKDQNEYTIPTITFIKDNQVIPLQYHIVPGGHEFNSFVLAVYNLAGPMPALQIEEKEAIVNLTTKKKVKLIVSLSCTMCPDLVKAMQRISIENNNIETEIYDIAHFPDIKEQYNIMSVPCMVIDDQDVHFGKKDMLEIVDCIK